MDNILLYKKLSSLPENLKIEVANFIDILINNHKKPTKTKAKFGSAKGLFKMKDNFDDPIEDFKYYQ